MSLVSRNIFIIPLALGVLALAAPAAAAETSEDPDQASSPANHQPDVSRIGGHVGVATPLAEAARDSHLIGQDRFFTIANPVGLSVHTSEKWTVDFEFIVTHSVLRA